MYPTLYRMLEKGYISDYKKVVGMRRTRVYYHIEPKGLEAHERAKMSYLTLVNGVLRILDIKSMDELNKAAKEALIAFCKVWGTLNSPAKYSSLSFFL